MSTIVRARVTKGNNWPNRIGPRGWLYWLCPYFRTKRGETRIKCGRCLHGVIIPKQGEKCAVCGATVYRHRATTLRKVTWL